MRALIDWPAEPGDTLGTALWTSQALADATGGSVHGEPFTIGGVTTDSREVMPGDLFVALGGTATDGHRFVEGALAAGAAAALVERPVAGAHVLVRDSAAALDALGRAARARLADDARVIAVTGSAGKTGVKEALYAAFDRASRGAAHRSVKSYNNHVGVPLSLARMPARTRFGVFEAGMNNAGELSALTRLIRPHVAVITTVAPAHIGNFADEAAIARAKAEVFEGLEPGGIAILPADNPHAELLGRAASRHAARVIRFGSAAHADVRLIDAVPRADGGTLVTAELGGAAGPARKLCFGVAQPGAHWVANALAVIAAVAAAGGDLGAAGLALAEMAGMPGRGARHLVGAAGGDGSGRALVIDESYNANPASMAATIAQLGATPAHRRIAVLGAMKELGAASDGYHAGLAAALAAAGVSRALLVGSEMAALAEALGKSGPGALAAGIDFVHAQTVAEAAPWLERDGWALQGGDAVLVKGSNSVGLAALVRMLVQRQVEPDPQHGGPDAGNL